MTGNLDKSIDAIHSGQQSRIIRNTTETYLIDREDDIVQQLVVKYRANQLTDAELRGRIGEIAGLRGFREYLETSIQKGTIEAERAHSDG
jgi:hypothetical protein